MKTHYIVHNISLCRPTVVTCMGTDESESLDSAYANRFRRPPTVGQFSVTSESSKINMPK